MLPPTPRTTNPRQPGPRQPARISVVPALAAALLLAAAAALPLPAVADDVHLTNGRSFENVVAEVVGDRVAIRLASGVIRIPKSKVARIDRRETALERYLDRRLALVEKRGSAAEWLELARWARDHDLATGYQEAARRAADLDPDLEGLEPAMRDLGLLYDEAADRWLSEDQLMQRRGYVRYDGSWVTAVERAEALARAAEAEVKRLEARRDASRDEALVQLATTTRVQAETVRAESETRRAGAGYAAAPFVYYTTGYWAPVYPAPGGQGGGGQGGGATVDNGGQGHHHTPRPQPNYNPPEHNRGTFRASDWIPGRLNPGAAAPPGRLSGSTARP